METRFQTSFIPKKPLSPMGGATASIGVPKPRPRRNINIFFDITLFLFIVSLGAAAAMYAWKSISLSTQQSYKQALADRQKQFNPDLIEELKRANVKIDTAKRLLSDHVSLSSLFGVISRFTVANVRFLDLDIEAPGGTSRDISIMMSGQGTNLSSVAFQSDVLAALAPYGLNKVVKNPIISDPRLNEAGVVSFEFSASIDPSTLIYMSPSL